MLRFAIASVLRSTFQDWELLVIGDACTDDTRQVVESFRDPRIRFHNLPRNVGEQSGPNNEGMRRARGQVLAFLNHDDLWFPRHLEICLEKMDSSGADLVFGLGLRHEPEGGMTLLGTVPAGARFPASGLPASCWLFRRELVEKVGPWKYYRQIRLVPSQDWIERARKSGAQLESTGRATLLILPSRLESESYLGVRDRWQAELFKEMCEDPDFLEKELTRLAHDQELDRFWSVGRPLRAIFRNSLVRLAVACGRHPTTLLQVAAGTRRGSAVDRLRESRGLPRLERQ